MSEREVWEYMGGPHDGMLMSVAPGEVRVGFVKPIHASGSYIVSTREDVERKQLRWVTVDHLSDRSTWREL